MGIRYSDIGLTALADFLATRQVLASTRFSLKIVSDKPAVPFFIGYKDQIENMGYSITKTKGNLSAVYLQL